MQSEQAILLFVRDERVERREKPLPQIHALPFGYREINRAICVRLGSLRDRVDLVLATGGGGEWSGADHLVRQSGETFGERIAHAVEETFALGYQQVVVIGNDSPDIAPEDVEAAFGLLQNGISASAAPTYDGGAFLIGLDREGFDRESFIDLPWQTPRLFDELCVQLSAATLPIIRFDYDSWYTDEGRGALRRLLSLGFLSPSYQHLQTFTPLPARHKAITRIFLTAPPLS